MLDERGVVGFEVGRDDVEDVVVRCRQQNPAESAHTNIVGTVGTCNAINTMEQLEWCRRNEQQQLCNSNGDTAKEIQQGRYSKGDTVEIQQWRHSNGDTAMEIQQWNYR